MKLLSKYPLLSFLALFFLLLISMTVSFDIFMEFYEGIVLLPISYAGYYVLRFAAVPVEFAGPLGAPGFCVYSLPHYTLEVTFGCTGIYALFIIIAAIAAFPHSLKARMAGIFLAMPAFYVYGVVRLVIMGVAGNSIPEWLDFIHAYVMEIVNVLFIMTLFIIWVRHAGKRFNAA